MADWNKIRKEYIKGGITQEKLAAKYGVSYGTLKDVAAREHWTALRDERTKKALEKTVALSAEKTAEAAAKVDVQIYQAASILLDKVIKAASQLDLIEETITESSVTETGSTSSKYTRIREGTETGTVDRYGLRQITQTLKDLKEIFSVKSDMDAEEQRARIAKLQKEAAAGTDDDDENGVVMLPEVAEVDEE